MVIGEGGSGGALALGVGNRIYMLENAVYSVISPESCAAILYRDSSRAPRAAAALKLTAKDLLEFGVIDGIVPEPGGGAQIDPEQAAESLRMTLRGALAELCGQDAKRLIDDRYEKFRRMGVLFTKCMKKPVLFGIIFVLIVLGVIVYSSFNLAKVRLEVCVQFNGKHQLQNRFGGDRGIRACRPRSPTPAGRLPSG